MGRFDRLPGIDDANSRRRNVLVGAGYALAGCVALGALAPEEDGDDATGGDGAGGTDTPTPTPTDAPETDAPASDDATPTERSDTPTPTAESLPEAGTLSAVSANPDWLSRRASRSGTGQVVTEPFEARAFTTFIYEHDGESNFVLELIDEESGETVDILVNEIGSMAGAVGLGLPESTYILDVTADGDWAVELGEPFAPDGEWGAPPAAIAGEAPDVYGEVEIDGRVTVSGEHEGESNFVLLVWDKANTGPFPDDVIFNEVGQFEGETSVQLEGLFYFVVEADGAYRIRIE